MTDKNNISCPICQYREYNNFWAMKGYMLFNCKKCHMVWDAYPPGNLDKQYNENYFINKNPKGGYANYFEGMSINRKTFTDRLGRIEKRLGYKGKLLDIGCALGDCLLEAKKLGWKEVEGLEISNYAYNFARKRGLKITKGVLRTSNYLSNSFDIVTMQDVIEHIDDPVRELKDVYKILKPQGWVFMVTPNIQGNWSKILGSLWYHYKPNEHILYFSEETVQYLLGKTGFVNIKTSGTYHLMSLGYILNRLRYYFPNLFSLLLNIVKHTPLNNLIFRVYVDELEAWAQKP